MIEWTKIFCLLALSTVCYGIVHDQFTARLCVEYFTVAHPPLITSTSPSAIGLAWGVYATWWIGTVVGVAAATLSQYGSWPKVSVSHLAWPVFILIGSVGFVSALSGFVAFEAAERGILVLAEPMSSVIVKSRHSVFLADLWAHRIAHVVGAMGGSTMCAGIWLRRKRWEEARP